ncbi:MAG: four helix bundle protein [Deltaproteobacteria bacterium]|nr:four helix bundle protein [Deltaproteobacteria bacterium]
MEIQERTFEFAIRIVKLCQYLDEKPGVKRILSKQLLRSGTSVGANIEEAQAGQSRADFLSKMSIASKEARETLYWLKLLEKAELISDDRLQDLKQEADEIVRILTSIVKATKQNG